MYKKLYDLVVKLIPHDNIKLHVDDSGIFTGFTLYDIKPFDSTPIEKVVKSLNIGWTVIVSEKESLSNKGSMMPPKCYIGKGGATLGDLSTALESLETSEA